MMSDKTPKEAMARVLSEIQKIIAGDGDYIFRGETEDYGTVTTPLYRIYEYVLRTEEVARIGGHRLTTDDAHTQTVADATRYTAEEHDDAMWEHVRQYGSDENRINFSRDYLIALFFACDGHHDRDGRLILYDRSSLQNTQDAEVKLVEPTKPRGRIKAQDIIFIDPNSGVLDVKPENIIPVPKTLKKPILDFLQAHHNITERTIYSDTHGYTRQDDIDNKADVYIYRGYHYFTQGSYQDAINEYTKAIEIDPQWVETYHNRGLAYKELGEYPQAIADYTEAIERDPQFVEAYYDRGIVYENLDELEHAIADHTAAIEIEPQFVKSYCGRGRAYGALDEFEHALADYETAIELAPQYADSYFGRGLIYSAMGEYSQAIADCEKVMELDPQSAAAYFGRGIVYVETNKYPHALADFSKAIELDPQFSEAYLTRADCYYALALGEQHEEKRHEYCACALEDRYTILEHNAHDLATYRALFHAYRDFCNRTTSDAEVQRLREVGMPMMHRALELAKAQKDKVLYRKVKKAFDALPSRGM